IVIVYKLPQKSREEIAAMFNLSDLKKTRVYQEILEEVQAEAQAEVQAELQKAKQREKAAILRMVSAGFTREEIATILDLTVAEVEATIAESQQN
ncbi:MAG: flagellar assembly protein H, partial [Phormidium sp.]